MRVLLVEDDPKVARFVRRGLVAEGFAVDLAPEGRDGLHLATTEDYDAVVLDLSLPHVDGMQILRAMRAAGRRTPVLVLTARGSIGDRVGGLNEGADDYLVKPFSFAELVARVRALLRRNSPAQTGNVLEVADLRMDLGRHEVTRADRAIRLTPREFSLLEYFLRNPGQVVTRTMIIEHVWDQQFESFTNVIDVYVRYLRRKIDEGFAFPLLHTVRGVGYVLSAESP